MRMTYGPMEKVSIKQKQVLVIVWGLAYSVLIAIWIDVRFPLRKLYFSKGNGENLLAKYGKLSLVLLLGWFEVHTSKNAI